MELTPKINKIPKEILEVLPKYFIEELEAYEKACSENLSSIERKFRLVAISSDLKAMEVSKEYPQEIIEKLWDIYPSI